MTDQLTGAESRNLPQPYHPGGGSGLTQIDDFQPFLQEGPSFRHYLEILWRRKWLALAAAVTVVVLGTIQVFTTTPLYRATATLQIDPEYSTDLMPYLDIGEASSRMPLEAYLLTQVAKLRSRSLAQRTILELDLANSPTFNQSIQRGLFVDLATSAKRGVKALFDRPPAPRREAETTPPPAVSPGLVKRLRNNLHAQPVRTTRLINVTYQSSDPELSRRVVNGLAKEFVAQNLDDKLRSVQQVAQYLEEQLFKLGSKIKVSEKASQDFAKVQNLTLNSRQEVNLKKLSDLIDTRATIETEMVAQRARYRAAQGAGPGSFPEILKDSLIRQLEGRMVEAQGKLDILSERYGPKWPAVKELQLELDILEGQITGAKKQAIAGATQEYRAMGRRLQEFTDAVEKQRQIVDGINVELVQFNMLERAVETDKQLYEGVLQRFKEAGVAEGLKKNDIRIVEEAIRPHSVYSPNKTRALMVSLALGLCLGVVAAFAAENLDRSIKVQDDVTQRLRLPALGVIPNLVTDPGRRGWKLPGKPKTNGQGLLTLGFGDQTPVQTQAWEAYRSFRTSVLLSHSNKPPQTILVTSALPGEGKTTTVVNTAIALAHTGSRTLILELDLRKPSLARAFGHQGDEGMSRYLSGNSDLAFHILETRIPNLFILPAGPLAPNPTELIGSQRMASALSLLQESFNFIVIDVPPSLHFTDALVLSPQVEGVIVVVRGGKTPYDLVRKVSDLFLTVGAKVLGVLINDGEIEGSGYGYYPYHYYYRRSGASSHRDDIEASKAS